MRFAVAELPRPEAAQKWRLQPKRALPKRNVVRGLTDSQHLLASVLLLIQLYRFIMRHKIQESNLANLVPLVVESIANILPE